MTLLLNTAVPAQPGTHVLAIGVGKYPHLLGGKGTLAKDPMGLEQLKSPAVSVKGLLDWFLSLLGGGQRFHSLAVPLASVEALASAEVPVTIDTPYGPIKLDPAIQDNVQQSFEDWLARLKGHPENVGVFYFCGHGVMVADQHLLSEDFGRTQQPWSKAFNISLTIRAVEREVQGSIFFFIDACRKIPRAVAITLGAEGPPLLPPNLGTNVSRRHTTAIYAAGEGELAFAPQGGAVSRFTAALLCALSGYCGVKAPGQQTWTVDGENLSGAIRMLLEQNEPALDGKAGSSTQVCEQLVTGPLVPLMTLSTVPLVMVRLDLAPSERRVLYELYLRSSKGNNRVAQKKLDQIFKVELPRGIYEVGAEDPDNKLLPVVHIDEELAPPMYLFTMKSLP